jgi:hypothetical protein
MGATAAKGRRRAAVLRGAGDEGRGGGRRDLLAAREGLAIGTVAAEVLAAALDTRLAAAGAALDAVDPQDVLSRAADGGDELAVVLKIRGHCESKPGIS